MERLSKEREIMKRAMLLAVGMLAVAVQARHPTLTRIATQDKIETIIQYMVDGIYAMTKSARPL